MKRLVFATNNAHKLEEARQIMRDGLEIVSLSEIGCHDDIPETADTLEGNALIKARWVHDRYGYDCFADDTGLMVDALDGAPGVLSARYAGPECDSCANVDKLLSEMEDKEDRSARFSTVIALVADGETHTFEGSVEGSIARDRHGEAGFGYDPVFVAEETGRSFAEMTPDEKNAISHRGRAMARLREFLGVITAIVLMTLSSFGTFAEEWRLFPAYDGSMSRIVDTSSYTYFLGLMQPYSPSIGGLKTKYGALFRYDKEVDELTWLSKQNKLSGTIVTCIEYNFASNFLVIAYTDGNVDLLYDNDKVVNIPGLALADSGLDKTVNSITFDSTGRYVYLATEFGYVVLDSKRGEVESSRMFNHPVKAVLPFGNDILVATTDALLRGNAKEFDFSNLEEIPGISGVQRLYQLGNRVYAFVENNGSNRVNGLTLRSDGSFAVEDLSFGAELGFEPSKDALNISGPTSYRRYDKSGKETVIWLATADRSVLTGSYNGRDIWFSAGRDGIYQKRTPASGSSTWTLLKDKFFPNASNSFKCNALAYHPQYGMLVRKHGYDLVFNSAAANIYRVHDLLSGYKDLTWTSLSTTYRCPEVPLLIDNPDGIAIDPKNSNHVYNASSTSGLFRLDMENPEKSIHLSKPSDFNGGTGDSRFIPIVEDAESPWEIQCSFATPKFDNAGNLWTAYARPSKSGEGSTSGELWVWTPEDRLATTDRSNYRPFKVLTFEGVVSGNYVSVLPLKASVNKNIVLYFGNTNRSSLLIVDHKGTLDTQSDDRTARMISPSDQDGNTISFAAVNSWYEDPVSGLVWVGTTNGVFTFSPTDALSNPGSVRKIKVARNDGTNLADYLLDGITVNEIYADSQDRKWFATTGAGIVMTNSTGQEIIRTYTTENSPLPSNTVYTMAYNPETDSMMIATDEGLAELYFTTASGAAGEEARCWPNPVHPNYYGYVTIDNLPDNAIVKIIDVMGNPVKECGMAEGGVVQWDVTNRYMKRVPGGVYFVIASKGPNSDSFSKVSRILVVD